MVGRGRQYGVKYLRTSPTEVFKATTEDLPTMGPNGQIRRARLFRSSDNAASWHEIPLELTPVWRMLNKLFPANWPPQFIDDITFKAGKLSFTFHDADNEWERPVLPGKLDVPSIWTAEYRPRAVQWVLRRLRHLDYDGVDRDLKWKDVRRLETPEPDQGPPPA